MLRKVSYVPAPPDWDAVDEVAIAIAGSAVTARPTQRHVGLLVRDEDGVLFLVHLAWHKDLRVEAPDEKYGCVRMHHLPKKKAILFADWCLTVAQKNKGNLPYSIIYSDEPYFDIDGNITRTDFGEGLSCATFILETFRSFGIRLVEADGWPPRPSDVESSRLITEALLSYSRAEHVQAQRELIGKVARFRPEEVAGSAGAYNGTPIRFEQAQELGEELLIQMNACAQI